MVKDLVFCLNATVPVFLLMVLGIFLRQKGVMTKDFTGKMNSFVFRISLPVLLFNDMRSMDFYTAWDTSFVLFCFAVSAASILLVTEGAFLLKRKELRGEFIQTSYRSSAALLGAALVTNLYGNPGMVPLMIIGAVPLYNIAAVAELSFFKPDRGVLDKKLIGRTIKEIIKNPLIIAIIGGLVWSLLAMPMPGVLNTTLDSVGKTATPMGLIALGASFSMTASRSIAKEAAVSTFIKLAGLGILFLPLAVHLGFRNDELAAALIMCCSPATVSSYVMAREMGHQGTLTAAVVMLSTVLCSFTLTIWLFLFRTMGII